VAPFEDGRLSILMEKLKISPTATACVGGSIDKIASPVAFDLGKQKQKARTTIRASHVKCLAAFDCFKFDTLKQKWGEQHLSLSTWRRGESSGWRISEKKEKGASYIFCPKWLASIMMS
jgi:hypothetical protein